MVMVMVKYYGYGGVLLLYYSIAKHLVGEIFDIFLPIIIALTLQVYIKKYISPMQIVIPIISGTYRHLDMLQHPTAT